MSLTKTVSNEPYIQDIMNMIDIPNPSAFVYLNNDEKIYESVLNKNVSKIVCP